MLYAYGVVSRGCSSAGLKGLDGAPVELLDAGAFAVAVSRLQAAPDATRERLVAHHRICLVLAEQGGVVPLRFGNVFASWGDLLTHLSSRTTELANKLEQLAGCVEMTLRIPGSDTETADSAGGEGTRYLLGKKRRLERAEDIQRALKPILKDWRLTSGTEIKAACLIDKSKVAAFQAVVKERARVSGPWAPSSFV